MTLALSQTRLRTPRRQVALLLVSMLATTVALQAQSSDSTKPNPRLPKVLLIATGGTIAGVQDAPGSLGSYRAGTLTAEQIIASVPELSKHAQIETEQFSNVPSTSITPAQWLALSKRIEKVLKDRDDLAGDKRAGSAAQHDRNSRDIVLLGPAMQRDHFDLGVVGRLVLAGVLGQF